MAQHSRYWSCSKLANKIRGTDKPFALGWDEWDDWHKQAKEAHPIRYYIAEELLSSIQDFVFYIPGQIRDIRSYIKNRFVRRHYTLTSKLKRGDWHDLDTRILHCCFDELVNFVEVEKAHMLRICHTENPVEKKEISKLSDKEAGLRYLEWEMSLTHDYLDENNPLYAEPTQQAVDALWVKDAYTWWTETRPARPDPSDVSGWSEYCDRKHEGKLWSPARTDEEREESKHVLDKYHSIEKQYRDEDTNMLIELIKHRGCLWT
jgi:hypothetical protein